MIELSLQFTTPDEKQEDGPIQVSLFRPDSGVRTEPAAFSPPQVAAPFQASAASRRRSQPVSAWVGTEEIELGDHAAVDLEKGAHTVTLAIPVDEPDAVIHCEIGEPEGSSARARPLL